MTIFFRQTSFKRLMGIAKPYLSFFIFGVLGTLLVSGADSFLSWLIKPIIDSGLVSKNSHFLYLLPFIMIVLFVCRGFASFASVYFINRIARTVIMVLRQKLFAHLQRLPIAFFDRYGRNKLVSLMLYNVEQISYASSQMMVNVIQDLALVIGLLLVMFTVCWPLALLFSAVSPLIFFVVRYASRRSRQLSQVIQDTMAQLTKSLSEMVRGIREIRVFGAQEREQAHFFRSAKGNQAHTLKLVVTKGVSSALIQVFVALPISVALWLTAVGLVNITAGEFASILTAMVMVIRPMRRLSQANSEIQAGLAGADSVFDVLDTSPEERSGQLVERPFSGEVTFSNVSFKYPQASFYALKAVSFSVSQGQMVAIVGPSGGGKSTLLQLLLRFYELAAGDIRIDGRPINAFDREAYWRQFSLVMQHPMIFDNTIAYNVAYGASGEIDYDRVTASLKAAQLSSFTHAGPDGVLAQVGEEGLRLSGGQRQRLALARAFYNNAPIVILDEATSALDAPTEAKIQAAVDCLRKQSTLFVIAHRLSTIVSADVILVIDQGRLVAQGTHEELLADCSVYQAMYRQSFQESVSC